MFDAAALDSVSFFSYCDGLRFAPPILLALLAPLAGRARSAVGIGRLLLRRCVLSKSLLFHLARHRRYASG